MESHKILANESFAAGSRQPAETEGFTVYLLVLEQSYGSLDGVLKEEAGSYGPAAITFSVTETGEYAVKDYWIPRDGSYYVEDIREKFPKMAAEEALNGQAYVERLQEECYQRALDVMNSQGSLSVKIANLLDIVQSSPSAASAPSAYIRAHNDEWKELHSYGEYSLRYCFAQFLQGGQTELKGKLMQQLCLEIMESQGHEQPDIPPDAPPLSGRLALHRWQYCPHHTALAVNSQIAREQGTAVFKGLCPLLFRMCMIVEELYFPRQPIRQHTF